MNVILVVTSSFDSTLENQPEPGEGVFKRSIRALCGHVSKCIDYLFFFLRGGVHQSESMQVSILYTISLTPDQVIIMPASAL